MRSRAIEVRGSGALARALPTWNRRTGQTERPSTSTPTTAVADQGPKRWILPLLAKGESSAICLDHLHRRKPRSPDLGFRH